MEKSCTIQDVFERFYPSYEKRNSPPAHHRKTAYHIMNCKTGAFGVNISVCEDCGCISIHNNSCRSRCCPFSYEVCHHHPNSSSIFFCKRSGFLNGSDCMFLVKSRKVSFQLGIYQHRQLLMHLYPWLCGSKNEQHWYSMHESWNP
jgi:hypothetical protein